MRVGKAVVAFAASGLWASSAAAMDALPPQRSQAAIFGQATAGAVMPMDDASITKRVEGKLADIAPMAEHVTVSTRNRIVTLSGRVESEGLREKLRGLATATKGVAGVNNQVVVVPTYRPAQQH